MRELVFLVTERCVRSEVGVGILLSIKDGERFSGVMRYMLPTVKST